MSDPKRWIDDAPSLSDDERRALEAGRDIQPPKGVEEALFASIMATLQLPPGTGGGDGGGAGGAAGAAGSGVAKAAAVAGSAAGGKAASTVGVIAVLKSFALGSGLAVAVIAGHQVLSTTTPAPASEPAATAAYEVASAPRDEARAAMPAPIPSAPEPAEPARPEPVRAAVIPSAATVETDDDSTIAEPAASATPAEAEPVDTALQESLLVARARAQVRSGRGGEALATLEEANRTIAHGILGQEREALAIEALAVSGRGAEAQSRARVFLDRFPNSPHAQQIRVYAGERSPSP